MKLFEKIKSLFRAKSLAEVEAADNRRSAKRLKTMMDKFDRCPSGPMSSVPKVARAFQF